jgi:hypothetical protein
MDDAKRTFVTQDRICWQYTIEHRSHEDCVEWRARVWEGDEYRGILEGRVMDARDGDPDAVCSVALKMVLDTAYLRNFSQDSQDAPASPDDDSGDEGIAGADPLPVPL